ncbi:MAG: hypothetical protein H6550_15885 [Chitinophagales bacterium]|nr:hypothetical protein [Chitinophagales bacterium]
MKLSAHKVGNWNSFSLLAANLHKELANARMVVLKRWALKAEGIAKEFLNSQELAHNGTWLPLSVYTRQRKARLGYPDDTLIETTTYFQAITSFVVGDTANAGVKRGKTYPNFKSVTTASGKHKKLKSQEGNVGREIATIAKWQEFGNAVLPARPLWQPTYKRVMVWHLQHNDYKKVAIQMLVNKYQVVTTGGTPKPVGSISKYTLK